MRASCESVSVSVHESGGHICALRDISECFQRDDSAGDPLPLPSSLACFPQSVFLSVRATSALLHRHAEGRERQRDKGE